LPCASFVVKALASAPKYAGRAIDSFRRVDADQPDGPDTLYDDRVAIDHPRDLLGERRRSRGEDPNARTKPPRRVLRMCPPATA
jgi:hypothetical protein